MYGGVNSELRNIGALLILWNPTYNKQLTTLVVQYNMEMTFHSHTCIFTRILFIKILTHALEISPHIVTLSLVISITHIHTHTHKSWMYVPDTSTSRSFSAPFFVFISLSLKSRWDINILEGRNNAVGLWSFLLLLFRSIFLTLEKMKE